MAEALNLSRRWKPPSLTAAWSHSLGGQCLKVLNILSHFAVRGHRELSLWRPAASCPQALVTHSRQRCNPLLCLPSSCADSISTHGMGDTPSQEYLPLMQGTRGLFDKEMIGRMKKGSYLVNTARGAICDTQAVKEALESGHLRGCERPCL